MNFKKSYVEMIRYPYRFSVHCIDCKIAQCSQYKERQWHVFLMPNYVLHKSNMGYCSYLENLIKDEAEYHVRTLQRTVWFYLYTLDTGKVLKWNCQIMHMCNHVFQNTWALHVLHIKNKTKIGSALSTCPRTTFYEVRNTDGNIDIIWLTTNLHRSGPLIRRRTTIVSTNIGEVTTIVRYDETFLYSSFL